MHIICGLAEKHKSRNGNIKIWYFYSMSNNFYQVLLNYFLLTFQGLSTPQTDETLQRESREAMIEDECRH